jgi:hypothetical protein
MVLELEVATRDGDAREVMSEETLGVSSEFELCWCFEPGCLRDSRKRVECGIVDAAAMWPKDSGHINHLQGF